MEATLRQKYNQLEQETAYEFSFLLATAKQEINFFAGEAITEEYFDGATYYEFRNDITGNCVDVFILSAGEDGLYIAEANDIERQYFIRFSDLASTLDRINLIEEMQELISTPNKLRNEMENLNQTFDIFFNDENNSNNKGFAISLEDAKHYIERNNGTNESYFADYKGGTVSIVCNETEETVFETEIF